MKRPLLGVLILSRIAWGYCIKRGVGLETDRRTSWVTWKRSLLTADAGSYRAFFMYR